MKNKSNIIILWTIAVLAIITAVVSFMITNQDDDIESKNYSASSLSVLEDYFDFGTISMKDGNVSHRFSLENSGSEPVIINKLYTSCMCTTVVPIDEVGKKHGSFGMHGNRRPNIEVGAGETIDMEAIFDPTAHGPSGVGLVQRVIYIETNSINSPKLELSFQATVTR